MEVLKLVHKALSDKDIGRILGRGVSIVRYSHLDEFQDLDEALPNATDYCVILYEDRADRGHSAYNAFSSSTSPRMAIRSVHRFTGLT